MPIGLACGSLGGLVTGISKESLEEATIWFCRGSQSYRNTMATLGDMERPFDYIDGKGRDINSISLN